MDEFADLREFQYIPEIFTSVHSSYKVDAKIGMGSFGSVYRITSKYDGKQFALKQMKIENHLRTTQLLEPQVFSTVENLLSTSSNDCLYLRSWIEHNHIFIKMQLMDGNIRSLYTTLQSERKLFDLLRQLCDLLEILHQNNFVHLDIKPRKFIRKRAL